MKNATPKQIADAFTEWERRYREDPAAFLSASERLAQNPQTYGEQSAPYFLEILAEVQNA